jgi:Flp pilus assembly protein TadD
LLGEVDRLPEARTEYLKVLQLEPTNAVAAYNLAVIAGASSLVDAIRWSGKAAEWRPQEPRYAYTHAYYLMTAGNPVSAAAVLQKLLGRNPGYTEARQLLRECQKAATSRP